MANQNDYEGGIATVTWRNVRAAIYRVNPRLAKAIDQLNPNNQFLLCKLSYPFWATLVKEGLLHLPLEEGEIVPITHQVLTKIRSDLSYAGNGLLAGIILKNSYEVFINTPRYTLPIVVATPGTFSALWRQLDLRPAISIRLRFLTSLPALAAFLC